MNTEQFYKITRTVDLDGLLQRSDELKKKIDAYKPLAADLQDTIHKQLKFHWTYHSNAIEGSTLTLGDTIFFLQEGLTVKGKPFKDFIDAKNHAEAIDYLYEIIADGRQLTTSLIKEINALLLVGIEYTPAIDHNGKQTKKVVHAGEYKKQPNHVVQLDGDIYKYVEPLQVTSQMEILLEWISANLETEHPVIVAAIAHYNMVRIHPFDDGNGRGARLLMDLILIKKEYPVAVIKVEDRKEYLDCLQLADNGNLEPFVAFVAKSVLDTQELILNELNK